MKSVKNDMNGSNYLIVMFSYYKKQILLKKINLNIMPDGMRKFFIHLAFLHTVKVFQCFFGKT